MTKQTYTGHKLTHAQCKRLNQLYNGRRPHLHGMALLALCRKGLVREEMLISHIPVYTITTVGREAYEQARQEGW